MVGPQQHGAPVGAALTGPAGARATRTVYVVLTRSDELLEQVGLALDGTGEVRLAENEEEARQFADPRHATVMLLDAREQIDPGLVVERLHVSDGSTVIVVFAPAGTATDVARAIKGSAAFAVLPIPLELEKTRVILQGAGEEALARRALVTTAATLAPAWTVPDAYQPSTERSPQPPVVASKPLTIPAVHLAKSTPEAPPAALGGTPRAPRFPKVMLAVVAGLLMAVTGVWLYWSGDAGPAPEINVGAAAPQAVTAAVPSQPAPRGASDPSEARLSTAPKEQLLDRARVAFHERRYTDPDSDNALYYYRSALAQDPLDAEAREGIERVGAVLDGRLRSALAERRADDAARTLEQLRLIRPDDKALATAAAQLAEQRVGSAIARGDADQANELLRAAADAGVPAERLAPLRDQLARLDASNRAAQLSRVIRARIRDGQLLTPPGDSAKHHLGQLLRLPNGARLGADVQAELARELAEQGRLAAAQGQGDEAARWLAEARALGHTPERRPAGAAATVAATAGDRVPATTERVASASVPIPQEVAAAPAKPEVSAADFRRTRYVAPVYPPRALARGQSGEVRVRVTVDTTGRVAEVLVLSASPAGVFDQAAVNAVRKWRFEPVIKDGRAIEASIATTILFRPDDAGQR
jgi:TonB family protein